MVGEWGDHQETEGAGETIIFQVKPFLPPPLHQPGHGDLKVRIYSMPRLDMNDPAPRDHHPCFRILPIMEVKEVPSQIKIRVYPQVGFAQGHEGHDVQDSRGS
jgi:hypothetical protein